jgi:hypothetical protein
MYTTLRRVGDAFKINSYPVKLFFIGLLVIVGCREDYNPRALTASHDLLVVDGFIDAGNEPTHFSLSRTLQLKDTVSHRPELGALVRIEGDDGFNETLPENSTANYSGGPFHFNSASKYRLHINTANGKEYYSDFIKLQVTPLIDSIGWERNSTGLSIYLNTHDATDHNRFYHWSFEQTWKFHSAWQSTLVYDNGYIVPRLDIDSIYTCWHTESSHDLLLGSTEALAENIIFKQPIQFIYQGSWQISVKYSILVKQQAIDRETYDYMQLLRKITEQSGGFFDPQPVTINGNLHCMNDSREIVLGHIYGCNSVEKRIYIDNSELPDWHYNSGCYDFYAGPGDFYSIADGSLIPLDSGPKGVRVTSALCGDCTIRGSHQKPDYWP